MKPVARPRVYRQPHPIARTGVKSAVVSQKRSPKPKPVVRRIIHKNTGRVANTKNVMVAGRMTKRMDTKALPRQRQVKKIRPRSSRPAIIRKQRTITQPRRHGGVRAARAPSTNRVRHDRLLRTHVNKVKEMRGRGKGRVLAMIACGPSILEIPLERLRGHPLIDTMAINKPDSRISPPTYWAFCDNSQYIRNKESFERYNGIVLNSSSIRARHPKQVLIRNKPGKGFSRDLTNGFHIGRSTTFANLQTAVYFNYDRIYIFGCDMSAVGGKMHFYGKNPDVNDSNRSARFVKEAEHFAYAGSVLKEEEREKIYFCSSYNKWPFVSKFNNIDHKVAIDEILAYVGKGSKGE